MELQNEPSRREPPQDATEDYPQSGRTFQVLCVRKNQMGGRHGKANAGSGSACSEEWSADLLGLRPPWAGLRPPPRAAVRVRAPLGNYRVFRVCHAAC